MKPSKAFKHPDNLQLKAAEGWFELGNFLEANAELENITPKLRVSASDYANTHHRSHPHRHRSPH